METQKRRIPKHLSPSGISTYRKDPEEYYLRYAATYAPERTPQTQAMAMGSAFDAYCKNYLHESLFGKAETNGTIFEFNALFEAQVSEEWRDFCILHGLYVFETYKKSGALGDLLLDLQQAVNKPKFEIEISGIIHGANVTKSREYGDLVLLGRPDVYYINKYGSPVIIDWKVNGYVSNYNISPKPGYVRLRMDTKKSGCHTGCVLKMHNGVLINGSLSLHEIDIDWGTQLAVYGWLAGSEVGDEFIVGIDQIVCNRNGSEFPTLRIAEHRCRVASQFQHDVLKLANDIWDRIHSDHYFREMSLEDSQARCLQLDTQSFEIAQLDQQFLDMTAKSSIFGKSPK